MPTFTPANPVDMSKEKSWAADLDFKTMPGMLDWDATNIVFTKRSLIEFLKYTGTTVDTNFNNIAKLPRYAKFGKISAEDNASDAPEAPVSQAAATSSGSRPPASSSIRDVLTNQVDDDALASAPPKGSVEERCHLRL
ncbi:hypothetical protein H0H93_012875 [Arthromyces matolae]|nr:hypothetical protein H0H93_012875 [Arthromyces matolae]